MSEGLNKVILFGNLGADPELKYAQSGTAILKLSLATNERVKKGEEWTDHTEWHRVTVFGKRAEGLSKFLAKGAAVMVEGRLRTSKYEKEGQTHYSTEINADNVILGGGGKRDGNSGGGGGGGQQRRREEDDFR